MLLGAGLVIAGVAALVFIFTAMESEDPGLRAIAIELGLGPAAVLSGLAQLLILLGGRMMFLAWRRQG